MISSFPMAKFSFLVDIPQDLLLAKYKAAAFYSSIFCYTWRRREANIRF
jgi:hypothetical protein